ncbi:MAG: hypothetical protein J6K53_11975 [Roseburia sp.]|nr:hypothetical protein [Roseburia sp.]
MHGEGGSKKLLVVGKILIAICIWLIVPVLLGSLWLENGRKLNDAFIWIYLMGLVSEWAAFFAIAKWAIASQLTLQKLCVLWLVLLAALTVFAAVLGIRRKRFLMPDWKKGKANQILGMLGLILLCTLAMAYGGSRQKEHTIEAALTMYATDSLYQYDATTGRSEDEMLSFEKAELEKDAKSPIEAYYAANSYVCRLNPAKFIRVLLPFFLLPFYFGVYQVWANTLFPESFVKRGVFQTVVWLLYGSAVIAGWEVLFDVFSNCWNGETLFFAGLLPLAVWLLLGERNRWRWFAQYVVCVLAGQMLYEKGGFLITFFWVIAWLVTGIRRWKNDRSI